MKFDVMGRIGNMRLPDGRTALLYSIYEAVSNAVQAIEERFGRADFAKRGEITILVEINSDKTLNYVAISDNGVGLNAQHLESFETCDTRQKYAIGGKGVGRLIWIKVFNDIRVKSTFETGLDGFEQVSFKFDPNLADSLVDLSRQRGDGDLVGTQIILSKIRPDQNAGISRSILARHICHHFFPYFIAGSMPRLTVMFGRREMDMGAYMSSKVDMQLEETLPVRVDLSCLCGEKDIAEPLERDLAHRAGTRGSKYRDREKIRSQEP